MTQIDPTKSPIFLLRPTLLFIFILSLPIQTVSIVSLGENGVGLKIYNLLFIILIIFSFNFNNYPIETISFDTFFKRPSLFCLLVYFLISFLSLAWCLDPVFGFSFFTKILFVYLETFFFLNLFYFNHNSFNVIRIAYEGSGIFLFLILIFLILKLGLVNYLATFNDIGSTTSTKNEYFGNIGLTFGGGKNLLGCWETIAALISYIHLKHIKYSNHYFKFFIKVAFISSSLGILLTFSRSALLAYLLSIFTYHLFNGGKFNKPFLIKSLVILSLLIPAISFTVNSDIGIFSHLFNIGSSDDPGSNDRFALWNTAFETIKDYPVLGMGIGNGLLAFNKYQTPGITGEDNFHNLFLQNFVELGIIGGFIFILFWFSILFYVFRLIKKRNTQINDRTLTAFYVFFSYTIMAFFQFKGGEPDIWIFIALNLSLLISSIRYVKADK